MDIYNIINYFLEICINLYLLKFPFIFLFGNEKIKEIDFNDKLIKSIENFIMCNKFKNNGIIVSLSGGVDSMVILSILIRLSKKLELKVYAVHINYNLRNESKLEANFLKNYCIKNNVKLKIVNIENTYSNKNKRGFLLGTTLSKRSQLEDELKDVRFDSYKDLMKSYDCSGVMVGHHMNDIIENIFTNSIRGSDLLNLEVMKKSNIIKEVNILRPLLDFKKSDIYDFAHKYDIPYFRDSTPIWSRRGLMRNKIFPLLNKVFGESWQNKYKEIGNQSNSWNNTINNIIINPWIGESYIGKVGILIPIKYSGDDNLWVYMLKRICYQSQIYIPKRKANNILSMIKNKKKSIKIDDTLEASIFNTNYLIIWNNKINIKINDNLRCPDLFLIEDIKKLLS